MPETDFYAPNYDEGEYIEKTSNKRKATEFEDMKKEDKHYYKILHAINQMIDGKFHKKVYIEAYSSGDTGTRIRDAVTGEYTKYLVGSTDEDLFFKTRDCTGLMSQRDDAGSFFYLSPEQYERARYCRLSTDIKEAWNKKYIAAMRRMQLEDN
uniref:Uncharacterized protein n=1 Tax=viral metagenome TaxID=1070528 RepID=A0A6C0F6J8_9ZZZZ